MMNDWKDMLSGLRDSFPDNGNGEAEEGEESAKKDILGRDERGAEKSAQAGVIHVVVERKGRKGKTATIAEGFSCSEDELSEIASKAKQRLGTGGSARGGEILMQGECKERFSAYLRELGYKVK